MGWDAAAAADLAMRDWALTAAQSAAIVVTVCSGIRFLGLEQLQDGICVTSHPDGVAVMEDAAPGATIRTDRIVFDNGHVVAASGLNGGLEAALHLVGRILGSTRAQEAARLIEYTPLETPSW